MSALFLETYFGGPARIAAIHASPPCQTFTRAKHLRDAQGGKASALDLVDPVRRRLRHLGVPYVIENVPGAPLYGATLCGSSFGLKVRRHRVFESNVYIPQPKCDHKAQGRPVGVYHVLNDNIPKGGKTAETLEQAQDAMGIDWLQWDDLKEAIPPAYTEHIGRHLREALSEFDEFPILLDLFCKGGGASMGYADAGFTVIGVDIEPQADYPFEFIQADALVVLDHLLYRDAEAVA